MNLDIFLEDLSENQKELILFWHQQFLDYPEILCRMNYNVPFFYFKSWICYLNPKKKANGIELVFIHGKKLHDESGVLKDNGRKQVAGILMDSLDENIIRCVHELFAQAIMLDEELSELKKQKK